MARYTVKDNATKKTVTFEWEGDAPPTDSDMAEVFSAARVTRSAEIGKGAKMSPQEASTYAADRAAFAQQGGVSTFGAKQGGDTRKISYSDTGYRPNQPAKSLKDVARNAVQDVVELPLMPVRMLSDIANSPDTPRTLKDIGVNMARGPLEFVPGVGEMLGGRSATEAWATNPGFGAMTLAGGAAIGRGVKAGMAERRAIPAVEKLTKEVDNSFNKAVRPSVENTRTAAQAAGYTDNARTAVKEIVINKGNYKIVNEHGEAVAGLPQNLDQFRQSIDGTKRAIWKKVEEINSAAGAKGAEVPLQSAVSELQSLRTNPVYSTMEPETVSYAAKRADALSKQRAFTVDQAQDAITLANQSLKNFYRNPSTDTASRAYVDSLIANHLRSNLDAALESATGTPAAAGLRKSYGSLKAIERDVNQRATVDARKNTKGLLDFADVYTAGELVNALASFNPAGIAKAGTMAAVKGYIKKLNDPNTHVKRVFTAADKLVNRVDIQRPTPYSVPTISRNQTVLDSESIPAASGGSLGDAIPGGYQKTYGWDGKQAGPQGVLNPEVLPQRSRISNLGDLVGDPTRYQREYGWEGRGQLSSMANPETLPPQQSSQMVRLSDIGGRIVPHREAMAKRVPQGFNPEVAVGRESQLGDVIPGRKPSNNSSPTKPQGGAPPRNINTLNPDAPARKQLSPNLLSTTKDHQSQALQPKAITWRDFVASKMSQYMKEEGSHSAAMKRMSREWKDIANKLNPKKETTNER